MVILHKCITDYSSLPLLLPLLTHAKKIKIIKTHSTTCVVYRFINKLILWLIGSCIGLLKMTHDEPVRRSFSDWTSLRLVDSYVHHCLRCTSAHSCIRFKWKALSPWSLGIDSVFTYEFVLFTCISYIKSYRFMSCWRNIKWHKRKKISVV